MFIQEAFEVVSDKFRELISSESADSETKRHRCLLLGPPEAQRAAIRRIREAKLPFVAVTDIPEESERNYDCILVMVDKRSQESVDQVYKVAKRLLNRSTHASRIGLTIFPGRQADGSKLIIMLHKLFPNKPWQIDQGDGAAAERALREMLRPETAV